MGLIRDLCLRFNIWAPWRIWYEVKKFTRKRWVHFHDFCYTGFKDVRNRLRFLSGWEAWAYQRYWMLALPVPTNESEAWNEVLGDYELWKLR